MNPIAVSTSLNSLQLKPNASSFEKFQHWLARKVVIEKSHFWNTIASIFQRCLPYFIELKTKVEAKADQLQGKIVTKVEIDRRQDKPSPSSTPEPQVKPVEAPAVSSSSTVASIDAQAPKPGIESTAVSSQPTSETSTPASSTSSDAEKPVATEQDIAKIKSGIERAAFNIDTAASLALSDLLERQKDAPVADISWPVKTAWNKLSSLWKAPKEKTPLLVMSMEVEQAIEGKGLNGNVKSWLEKQKEERDQDIEKLRKGEIDQEAFKKFQLKMAQLQHVLNTELPNQELPLHYAIRLGKPEMVKLLLSLGANPVGKNVHDMEILRKDRLGNTAWDSAALSGTPEIAEILRNHFKSLFKEKLAIGVQNVISRGIPFSPQVFQMLEDEVKASIANLLGTSSSSISDPLALSNYEKIRLAAFVTLMLALTAQGGMKTLGWQEGYLAYIIDKLVLGAANIGTTFQALDLSQQFMTFITGLTRLDIPFATHILFGMFIKQIPILNYFEPVMTYTAMGSSIYNFSFIASKNIRQRPGAVIMKAAAIGVNTMTFFKDFFTPHSSEGKRNQAIEYMQHENNFLKHKVDFQSKWINKVIPDVIASNMQKVKDGLIRSFPGEESSTINTAVNSITYACPLVYSGLMKGIYSNTDHGLKDVESISALNTLREIFCK